MGSMEYSLQRVVHAATQHHAMRHPLVLVATEDSYYALAPGALPSSEERVTEVQSVVRILYEGVHVPAECHVHLLRGVQTRAAPLSVAVQRVCYTLSTLSQEVCTASVWYYMGWCNTWRSVCSKAADTTATWCVGVLRTPTPCA